MTATSSKTLDKATVLVSVRMPALRMATSEVLRTLEALKLSDSAFRELRQHFLWPGQNELPHGCLEVETVFWGGVDCPILECQVKELANRPTCGELGIPM